MKLFSKDLMIRRIVKSIKVYPSTIELMRERRVDDGMNGYTVEGTDRVATITGFLDKKGKSLSFATSDGGVVTGISKIIFIAPFSNDFEILKDDFFNLNGTCYKVKDPNLQYDVCYLADLEVIK